MENLRLSETLIRKIVRSDIELSKQYSKKFLKDHNKNAHSDIDSNSRQFGKNSDFGYIDSDDKH